MQAEVFLSCSNACLKGGLAACRFTAGSGRADIFIFGTFRSPVFPPPGCCQVYGRQTKTRLEQSYVFLERKTQRRLTALHVGQTGEPFGFSQDHPRRPSHWAHRSRLLSGRHAGQRQSSAPPALERARNGERARSRRACPCSFRECLPFPPSRRIAGMSWRRQRPQEIRLLSVQSGREVFSGPNPNVDH
jgi:hypothetical protein